MTAFGDQRLTLLSERGIDLLAAVTGLAPSAVRRRLRTAHGGMLVRNAFEQDWPRDSSALALLTVATARDGNLEPEIAAATELTERSVRSRLAATHGGTRLSKAIPELMADEEPEDPLEEEWVRDRTVEKPTVAANAGPSALVGTIPVVCLRRSQTLLKWLARAIGMPVSELRSTIRDAHGNLQARKLPIDAWPDDLPAVPPEVLSQLRVAVVRRSGSLVQLVADAFHLPAETVAAKVGAAPGNMLVRNLVSAPADGEQKPEAPPSRVKAQEPPASATKGTPLVSDRYRIIRKLAKGGFGVAFEAHDLHLNNLPVVLKRALDADSAETLRDELGIALCLKHENICSYRDIQRDPSWGVYVILEHGGESLDGWIERPGGVAVGEALEIIQQAAVGLDFAHEQGVIHQDVKPENILVRSAPRLRVMLTDFGVSLLGSVKARTNGNATIVAGTVRGWSPLYAAPEQLAGRARKASDQYSLALVLCSMLDGRMMTERFRPRRFPQLNDQQNRAILRALEVEPERRFPSCGAFVRALRAGNA